MAVGTLMPMPRFPGLDANSDPVAGGLLWTFVAGTSTPVATYTDVALTVPHANPIVLNSAGWPASGTSSLGVYLTPGASYKFELHDAHGATIWTQDQVAAVPTASQTVDVVGTAGEALAANSAVYLSSGARGRAAGQWFLTDADFADASSVATITGIALAAVPLGTQGAIRTQGTVPFPSAVLVPGTVYYASATAGALSATVAGLSNLRAIGQALDAATLLLGGATTGLYTVTGNADTGVIDNWAPSLLGNSLIEWSGGTDLRVTGLAGGTNGQVVILKNISPAAATIYLTHLSSASAPANRLANMVTSGLTPIGYLGSATYLYVGGAARWELVSHEPGQWIPIPYSAANFSGVGGMTWTVDAADVTTFKYSLRGRTLQVSCVFQNTSVGGTLGQTLQVAIPFTGATTMLAPIVLIDAGVSGLGISQIVAGGTLLQFLKASTANMTAATNTTALYALVTLDVV